MQKNNYIKEYIKDDKKNYFKKSFIKNLFDKITYQNNYRFFKQIKYARKYQYYKNNRNSVINKLLFIFYSRLNNKYGIKNNIELKGKFGKNLKIYHNGIIITKNAMIGDNVKLHGNNCIGIKNNKIDEAPQIGNNVEIGYGACIIGKIKIADGIIIGANSVVTKSFETKNIIIAGNPAKKIKNKEEE